MFSIGDKVIITRLNDFFSAPREAVGKAGRIVRIRPGAFSDTIYMVEFPELIREDTVYAFREDELELNTNVNLLQVKVKKLSPDVQIPKYATKGSACFDLVANNDAIIHPGETKAINTGLAFEIPDGYQMKIHPRSGISLKTPLRVANAPGCIDSDYRGEVKVLLWNSRGHTNVNDSFVLALDNTAKYMCGGYPLGTYLILRGDRIAQAEIVPVLRAEFTVVDQLNTTERGEGGFGSSGITTGD